MKLLTKVFFSMSIMLILIGCTKNSTIKEENKPSSYDGIYYSYDSIVKKTGKELFNIKNGQLDSKLMKATVNEGKMKLNSKSKSYQFAYNEGEFVVLDKNNKSILTGYKKNSRLYSHIDSINGAYLRSIEPRLKKLIRANSDTTINGTYVNTNYESAVSEFNIMNGKLQIVSGEDAKKVTNYDIELDNVEIAEPLWDKEYSESIDKKLLEDYSSIKTISKLKDRTEFTMDFKLNESSSDYLKLSFLQDDNNEISVKLNSKNSLGEFNSDDIFEKKME